MLTALDECLWHQLPTTFDHVGTSDPRFFDRFWFAVYAQDGTAALQHALGVYNNMNVVDGGVVLVADGRQHNARFSRSLRPHFVQQCGPLKVDVIEPLQRFQVILEPGDHGLSVDLDWQAVSPPEEEKPHFQRSLGRVVQDYQRFNQIGLANGTITVGDRTIDVRDWWSCRDHSWGVRPDMGIPEPVTSEQAAGWRKDLFFCFLFFSTDTLAGHVQLLDPGGGATRYPNIFLRDRRTGAEARADDVRVAAEFIPGTRKFKTVELSFDYQGSPLSFTLTNLSASIAMAGLGYSGGWNDGRGLGAWRGNPYAEHESWDVSHPVDVVAADGSVKQPAHRIHPVHVRASDGSEGTGSFTWMVSEGFPLETISK